VLALALALPSAGFATAADTEERRLEENEARIAEVRAQIGELSGRVELDAAGLAEAERQLGIVLEAVNAATQAVQRQQQAVDDANARCGAAAAAVEEQRRIAGGRAVERYKRGAETTLQSMLVADDPADALNRSTYLDVVSHADERTKESLEAALAVVDAECRRVGEEQASLTRVLEQEQRILAEAETLRNERVLTLAATNTQLAELQAEENHLDSESRELGTLARRGGSGYAGPGCTGLGVFPADGPITSTFGRRWGRMHQGLDIGVPSGSPIYAAFPGVVSFAGRSGGYGNLMLVDHGSGCVTAYAHQTAFVAGPGDNVTAGQQIGKVGSTGNSTGPHLHFEVRVNGTARDPAGYLP
jgi:murein DD-endopeptidase MepM/ murein hydrolase activator NlpD